MSAKTHAVENQVPPLEPYDAFESDTVLREAVERWCDPDTRERVTRLGRMAGSPEYAQLGIDANTYTPVLRTHDRFGSRIDEVDFHPSWHALLQTAVENGLHASPWSDAAPDAHFERAAKFYLWSQVEAGHGCPISMTYAAVPALRHAPEISQLVEPRLAARRYEPRLRWIGEKGGALCGMGMTEKHGGSDVRANMTQARFAERTDLGDAYL
ncbi:MAG: DNA alkylation response protein, partial [Candidatus Eremiobacteraeota bacterium]|nr:DNA alkylation response protein [Candidatus Eremiobacteraeota bacterium]